MPDQVTINQGNTKIGGGRRRAVSPDSFTPGNDSRPQDTSPGSFELTGSRLAPRNPLFVGREKLLADLAERMRDEGGLALLVGYGGLGKTQTGIEFGHRYRDRFPGGVFFLNCAQPDLISGEVTACGDDGRLPISNYQLLPQPDKVKLVLREWRKPITRLIIMDNAEDPAVVSHWRRLAGGGCRFLVTARRDLWPPTLAPNVIRLQPLDRPDSIRLLVQDTDAFAHNPAAADANTIAHLLGDLPLALHCAASLLIAHHALSPADYLHELLSQASGLQHLSPRDWLNHELPTAHIPNVAAAFELSYQSLITNNQSPSEIGYWKLVIRIFHLLAHCAPGAPLPREVLAAALGAARALSGPSALSGGPHPERSTAQSKEQPAVEERGAETTQRGPDLSDNQLTEALRELRKAGLIELDEELRPSIHRLLQEFARLRNSSLPPGEGVASLTGVKGDAMQIEKAVGNMAYEINAAGLPHKMGLLREHLRALAEQAEARESENAGWLFNELGYHLDDIADYAAARAAFERALVNDERAFGPDHPNIAIRANNLGLACQTLGDLSAARAAFERALAIDKKAFGLDHPNVAVRINNLGLVYQALGDLPVARSAYERALAIDEKALGPNHPTVATDVNNLGLVHQALGDLPAARAALERALAIFETSLGDAHPNTQTVRQSLASLSQNQKRSWWDRVLGKA